MGTLDHAFHALRTLGGRLRFFRGGWGAIDRHRAWLASVRAGPLAPPPLAIRWRPLLPSVSLGVFASPGADYLPPASGLARLLRVAPAGPPPHPTVLLLAATGDHGFLRRVATLSWRLRRLGIASLVLEGPFYGRRAPPGQGGARLERVAHLADLGRATIEEGVALLQHVRREGAPVAVSGVSQGGLHAAMVASQAEGPTPVVMGFAPHSAAPVFTKGVLAKNVDWGALREDAVRQSLSFAQGDERSCLREALEQASIDRFPEHGEPARHVLMFGRADG